MSDWRKMVCLRKTSDVANAMIVPKIILLRKYQDGTEREGTFAWTSQSKKVNTSTVKRTSPNRVMSCFVFTKLLNGKSST